MEEIDESTYKTLVNKFPTHIDWDRLGEYEFSDDAVNTNVELACSGGQCEI